MNPSRQRLIILGTLLGLALVFLGWLVFRGVTITALRASDLVAANTQFTPQLNSNSDDGLIFFTGSAVARLELSKTSDAFMPSQSLTSDIPFENVDRISRGKSATIVRSYYSVAESQMALPDAPKDGWAWFVVDKDSKVSLLPLLGPDSITDCLILGDTVYSLVRAGGSQDLVSFKLSDKKTSRLADGIASTAFVGLAGDHLVMRDLDGNIYSYDTAEKSVAKVASDVGEATTDPASGKLITTGLASVDIEQGDGPAAIDKTITIRDLASGQSETIKTNRPAFFVSRGYLLLPSSLARPGKLLVRDLKSGQERDLAIDQSQTKVTNTISQLVVVKRDLSQIAAITNQNFVQMYGEPKYINKLRPYRLPVIQDTQTDYILDYDIGTSRLSIFGYGRSDTLVAKSLDTLAQTCKCDPNQINKKWGIAAESPGL